MPPSLPEYDGIIVFDELFETRFSHANGPYAHLTRQLQALINHLRQSGAPKWWMSAIAYPSIQPPGYDCAAQDHVVYQEADE